MCQMHQEKGFKFFMDTKNNKAFPLDSTYPKHLSVQSPTHLPYITRFLKKTSHSEQPLTAHHKGWMTNGHNAP
jgi:hypothetical protein